MEIFFILLQNKISILLNNKLDTTTYNNYVKTAFKVVNGEVQLTQTRTLTIPYTASSITPKLLGIIISTYSSFVVELSLNVSGSFCDYTYLAYYNISLSASAITVSKSGSDFPNYKAFYTVVGLQP